MSDDREKWLNGWCRHGDSAFILLGPNICCIGCGRYGGTTCVVISVNLPDKEPDWPFNERDCPVCAKPAPEPVDKLTQRAAYLKDKRK